MGTDRLPLLTPDRLDEAQLAVYHEILDGPRVDPGLVDAAGRLQGPFNAMLYSPYVGGPLQELGAGIRHRSSLSLRAREIAILEVARAERSLFQWHGHAQQARVAGLNDAQLGAILAGSDMPGLTPYESAVRQATQSLLTKRDISDGLLAEVRRVLNNVTLTELVALVGYYQLLALSLRVWRVPAPAGAVDQFEPAEHAERSGRSSS